MKVGKQRKGIATIVGAVMFAALILVSAGAYVYLDSLNQQTASQGNGTGMTNDNKTLEQMKFVGNPSNGTLALTNLSPFSSQITAVVLAFSNGSIYTVTPSKATIIGSGQLEDIRSFVGTQTCGGFSCVAILSFLSNSTNPGDWIGVTTSLGNTFAVYPAQAVTENLNGVVDAITFDAQDAYVFGASPALQVDGINYTYSQLPITFIWFTGTTHSYTFYALDEPLSGYKISPSVTGLSTLVSTSLVVSKSGTIDANYFRVLYTYLVIFSQTGLVAGDNWSVTFDGNTKTSTGSNITFPSVLGTYQWGVTATCAAYSSGCGYKITPAAGNMTIPGPHTEEIILQQQYYLTMESGAGGTTTPSTSEWVNSGSTVTISESPNSGATFDGWYGQGTGSYTGTATSTQITMDSPITELASFSTSTTSYSVTFQSSPDTEGTVSASGPSCTPTSGSTTSSSASFALSCASGSSVSLSETPVTGYYFTGWTTSGAVSVSGSVATVSGAGTVTGSFAATSTSYSVTFQSSPSDGGTIIAADSACTPTSGSGSSFTLSCPYGTSVALSETPASTTWTFEGFQGTGVVITGNSRAGYYAKVEGNGVVTAEFGQYAIVTFSTSGLGSDASGTVLSISIPSISYSGTFDYSQLPVSIRITAGASISYTWASTLTACSGCEYLFAYASGLSSAQSGSFAAATGTESATYNTYYKVTVVASPPGGGTVSPTTPEWIIKSGSIDVNAIQATGYQFYQWTATAGLIPEPSTTPLSTVLVDGPGTVTADFAVPTEIIMGTSSCFYQPGGTVEVCTISGTLETSSGVAVSSATINGYLNNNYQTVETSSSGIFDLVGGGSTITCYSATFDGGLVGGIEYDSSSVSYGGGCISSL